MTHAKKHELEFPAEFATVVEAVETGIIFPTHVETSYGNSLVFVDTGTTNINGDPLRIPIKQISGTSSGRIRTFFFASTDPGANIIWRRPGQ